MSFLRLSTNCAVFDDDGQILLSKRGDLGIWNLPGGRLDSGEYLQSAAGREVREETGVIVHVERAVGLYYWQGWQRLNVLYAGFPVGGSIVQKTFETRENRFFAPDKLPAMRDIGYVQDASDSQRPIPQIITSPSQELRYVRWALRRRYITNLLRGKPEPRHVRFNVQAVGIIWERTKQRILTLSNRRLRSLPRIVCDGSPPWQQLTQTVRRYVNTTPQFHWVGVWQYPETDSIEFIFAATVRENELVNGAEWSSAQNAALNERDTAYLKQTAPEYAAEPVWSISQVDTDATYSIQG